MKRLQFIT